MSVMVVAGCARPLATGARDVHGEQREGMTMAEDYGRQIVIVQDGGVSEGRLVLGTVSTLAELVQGEEHGDYLVTEVYGLNQLNELKLLNVITRRGEFDAEDFAEVNVTVVFPDGSRESAPYRVDGRS